MQIISLDGADWLFKGYIGEDWIWRHSVKPVNRDVRGWQRGCVPGSVQHDLWQAGVIPDPYFEQNSLAIEWVPERTWLYKKTFTVDPPMQGQRVELVFEGVDYAARYYLNGIELGSCTGMYLPAKFEIGSQLNYAGDNLLAVVIDPAPFEQPQIGNTSKVYTQKARMNYWWDFCPRMIHLGIWQGVYLHITGPARIEDVWVRPTLSANNQQATVDVTIELDGLSAEVDLVLRREGVDLAHVKLPAQAAVTAEGLPAGDDQPPPKKQYTVQTRFVIDQPELWWPNGSGDQPLYQVVVTTRASGGDSDQRLVDFGIRRVEFIANEGADPSIPGYTLVVNGRKIYIKGWNWVPADVLYGAVQPERYQRLLELAGRANVNLLRVWGGGLIEREVFYTHCDRLGILVWQEFIQSSSGIDNYPSSDPAFVSFLVQNAEAAMRLRRNHPALAVWCGGNELHFDGEHLCDERHPALAALSAAVRRMDPDRTWYPSSPSGGVFGFGIPLNEAEARLKGDVHGPWEYQGVRKQYELYNQGESLLHSEFGVEGLTNRSALDRSISPERQWPVSLNNPVWEHLAAWWVKEKVWQEAFGPMADVDTVQRATQLMQSEGLRYAIESDRRRMYHNSGSMPWQFNEPYPMAACTSAVDYFGQPKPSYYAVARAYAPVSLTARYAMIAWGGESLFEAQIWCANDQIQLEGEVIARLIGAGGQVFHETALRINTPENSAQPAGDVSFPLAQIEGPLFFLDLLLMDNQGNALAANRYPFTTTENLASLLTLPMGQLQARVEKTDEFNWAVNLHNPADYAALWIWLESKSPDTLLIEDNGFCLLPGESRRVQLVWQNVAEEGKSMRVTGWNFPEIAL